MKNVLLQIIFALLIKLELGAQGNEFELGYSLSYGWPSAGIKNKVNPSGQAKNVQIDVNYKNNLKAGVELEKKIGKGFNLISGVHLNYINSAQFAEGPLFASDQSAKCLINDSCSSFKLNLTDLLINIPSCIEVTLYKKKIGLQVGLNHYLLTYSRYDYVINESHVNTLTGKGTGPNFSEFTSRYNIAITGSVDYEIISNLRLVMYYEAFLSNHRIAAPARESKLTNIGLKVSYWPKLKPF